LFTTDLVYKFAAEAAAATTTAAAATTIFKHIFYKLFK
jgi:hypothetical protein